MRHLLFKFAFLRMFFFASTSTLLLLSCHPSPENPYFKLTISDELHPEGILPEIMEVSNDGKLVILSNRFNEEDELYQRTHFIELNKAQLDTLKNLMTCLQGLSSPEAYDSTFSYKISLEHISNQQRQSELYLARANDSLFNTLLNYCKKLPDENHRYLLKQSYYFNTDEICLEVNTSE